MRLSELLNEKVYHGTPHSFNQFDISKIGTGEGNQQYGYGLYFTETPAIAKWYRHNRNISDYNFYVDGTHILNPPEIVVEIVRRGYKDTPEQYANIIKSEIDKLSEELSEVDKENTLERNIIEVDIKVLQKKYDQIMTYVGKKIKVTEPGMVYESIIPDSYLNKMLDWDISLNEQSTFVKNKLNEELNIYKQSDGKQGAYINNVSGEQIYKEFIIAYDSDKKASARLNELGIVGIKYLDKFSRYNYGTFNTKNYVIFDEALIKYINKHVKEYEEHNDELE